MAKSCRKQDVSSCKWSRPPPIHAHPSPRQQRDSDSDSSGAESTHQVTTRRRWPKVVTSPAKQQANNGQEDTTPNQEDPIHGVRKDGNLCLDENLYRTQQDISVPIHDVRKDGNLCLHENLYRTQAFEEQNDSEDYGNEKLVSKNMKEHINEPSVPKDLENELGQPASSRNKLADGKNIKECFSDKQNLKGSSAANANLKYGSSDTAKKMPINGNEDSRDHKPIPANSSDHSEGPDNEVGNERSDGGIGGYQGTRCTFCYNLKRTTLDQALAKENRDQAAKAEVKQKPFHLRSRHRAMAMKENPTPKPRMRFHTWSEKANLPKNCPNAKARFTPLPVLALSTKGGRYSAWLHRASNSRLNAAYKGGWSHGCKSILGMMGLVRSNKMSVPSCDLRVPQINSTARFLKKMEELKKATFDIRQLQCRDYSPRNNR